MTFVVRPLSKRMRRVRSLPGVAATVAISKRVAIRSAGSFILKILFFTSVPLLVGYEFDGINFVAVCFATLHVHDETAALITVGAIELAFLIIAALKLHALGSRALFE